MAPEIVSRKEYSGQPTDLWAIGILLFAMLIGTYPFRAENEKELYRRIIKGNVSIPEILSSDAKHILKKLLNSDPTRRIKANEVN
jgi:serine/threonine protein kinase